MQYEVKTLYGLQKRINAIGVAVPGSKSLTARALMLAVLKDGITEILNILPGPETESLLSALFDLGFEFDLGDEGMTVIVYGKGGDIPVRDAKVNLGCSLMGARCLPSILAFAGGEYYIDGGEAIRKRSYKGLFDALIEAGVRIIYHETEGCFPVTLISDGIKEGTVKIAQGEHSGYVSGLMIAQMISPSVTIMYGDSVRKNPFTEEEAAAEEQRDLSEDEEEHEVYFVEPDMTYANYYFAMALILGITVQVADTHTDSVQSDIEFLRVLKRMGCSITDEEDGIKVTGPKDGIYRAVRSDFSSIPEQTYTYLAAAAFAKATTHITGVEKFIKQESERLEILAAEFAKIGVKIKVADDGITVHAGKMHGGVLDAHGDVRIAMIFALIGLREEGVMIDNAECIKKHFGEFFATIDKLRSILEQK